MTNFDLEGFPSDRILHALSCGREAIAQAGLPLEPPEVGTLVERHRWAWKPEKVRVLLIAESHVFTSASDLSCRVRPDLIPPEARHAPEQFVRLVYCLGYGESAVLEGRPEGRNGGTWQFWNLFGRVAGTGRQPTTLQASWQQRIAWKVNTLKVMQEKGVWLLDASLHGIYAPGATRVPPSLGQRLHEIWWREYGHWLLAQSPGAYRCAIGRGVARTLIGLGVPIDGWIYQPQARALPGRNIDEGWPVLLETVASSDSRDHSS